MREGQKRCSRQEWVQLKTVCQQGNYAMTRLYCQRQTAFSGQTILGWTVFSQTRINARKQLKFLAAH